MIFGSGSYRAQVSGAARRCVIDGALVAFAIISAALLRYDLVPGDIDWRAVFALIMVGVIAQWVGGVASGLYTGRWRPGTWDELRSIALAAAGTAAAVVLFNRYVLHHSGVSSSVGVIGSLGLGALLTLERYLQQRRRRALAGDIEGLPRAIIIGAGEAAAQLLEAFSRESRPAALPVALLDDDPSKRRLRLAGIPVVGTTQDIPRVSEQFGATRAVVAMPSAPDAVVLRVVDDAGRAGLRVTVLPSISSALGVMGTSDAVRVDDAHLLGREEVSLGESARYISGQTVLVTGAGGSIGAELCKQIATLGPKRLFLLDRDETALHGTQLGIHGEAALDSPDLVLADIRDAQCLHQAFANLRPDIVFHAAALKHVAILEQHPREAFLTNVLGTLNVLTAASSANVCRLVNISTDKAADPASVLGMTKRVAERLTADFAQRLNRPYVSVRFGNVIGSRGSVLTTFRAQLQSRVSLTVTDPDATRYFMTVSEAVQLVIQAGAIGGIGEVLVLDMGKPVKIADVARRLAVTVDPPADIVFTGLRKGEKLHESLFAQGELSERPFHPLISHVLAPRLSPAAIPEDLPANTEAIISLLRELVSSTSGSTCIDAEGRLHFRNMDS